MDIFFIRRALCKYFNYDIKGNGEITFHKKTDGKHTGIIYSEDFKSIYNKSVSEYYGVDKSKIKVEYKKDKVYFVFDFSEDHDISFDELYKEIKKKKYDNHDVETLFYSELLIRGTLDITTKLYAMDWKKNNQGIENLENFMSLALLCTNPRMINYNYRHLQQNSSSKNDQVRVSLIYLVSIIEKFNIENFNFLTFKTLKLVEEQLKDYKLKPLNKNLYIKINEYIDIINSFEKNSQTVDSLRKLHGYTNKENDAVRTRSNTLKKLAINTLDEKCYSCCELYNISDRSYLKNSDNSYYLEVHHFLPFELDKEKNDNIYNLVTLCPCCHRALTKNTIANHETFINFNKNILQNSPNIKTFFEDIYNITDEDEILYLVLESCI